MTSDRAVLAVDLGTSSVKCLVVNQDGIVLGRGNRDYPVSRPQPGWAEQEPVVWWKATGQAIRQALSSSPRAQIKGIGLTGQMHGTVLLDAAKKPLRPAIIWEDTRSGVQVDDIPLSFGRKPFIDTTGSPPATGFQAATLRWLQEHEPRIWSQTKIVLLPKDYIRFKLSGEFAADPSDASGTVLLDVRARSWSEAVLECLGIPVSMLPPIVASDAISARLSNDVARELGLTPGMPIAGGAGDASAASLASGGTDPGTLMVAISTGSQAMLATSEAMPDPQGRIHSWCHCLPPESGAGWYMMAATMASGLALGWLRDQVFALPSDSAHVTMEQWAAEIAPGASGLVFAPYLAGERTPHMDPRARGVFVGLTPAHDRRHLTRAVMEGCVLALYDAYRVLVSLHEPPRRIVLTGGGARSPTWTKIVADVFELPVFPNQEVDGSALGAAMLGGSAFGWFTPLEGASDWLRLSDQVDPDQRASAVYREIEEVFLEVYPKHQADFRLLEKLS